METQWKKFRLNFFSPISRKLDGARFKSLLLKAALLLTLTGFPTQLALSQDYKEFVDINRRGSINDYYHEAIVMGPDSIGVQLAKFECESVEIYVEGNTPPVITKAEGGFPELILGIKPCDEPETHLRIRVSSDTKNPEVFKGGPRKLYRTAQRPYKDKKLQVAILRNEDWPAGFRDEMIMLQRGPLMFWWQPGATYILSGKSHLLGLTIDSNPEYPLTFKLTAKEGYWLLCGRGKLTKPDGKVYLLGSYDSFSSRLAGLSSKDETERESAAQAIGYLATSAQDRKQAVKSLVSVLKDKSAAVRRNACEALGKLGDPSVIAPLKEVVENDADEWVKEVAKEAIELIQKTGKLSAG